MTHSLTLKLVPLIPSGSNQNVSGIPFLFFFFFQTVSHFKNPSTWVEFGSYHKQAVWSKIQLSLLVWSRISLLLRQRSEGLAKLFLAPFLALFSSEVCIFLDSSAEAHDHIRTGSGWLGYVNTCSCLWGSEQLLTPREVSPKVSAETIIL